MRRAAKIDTTQPDIIRALKAAGISVEIIGKPLDLLLHNPRKKETSLMECKSEGGRFTKDQVEFIARWPGPVYVAKTPEEAVALVIGQEAMA